MKQIACAVLVVLLASCVANHRELSSAQRADSDVIEGLRRAGSDVSKLHATTYYLYFPGEKPARDAGADLQKVGYALVKVAENAKRTEWVVIASKPLIPTLAEVTRISRELNALARKHNGDYDGWEAAVTK